MNIQIKSLSNMTTIWLQFFLVAMLPEYTLPLSKIQLSLSIQVGLVTGSLPPGTLKSVGAQVTASPP